MTKKQLIISALIIVLFFFGAWYLVGNKELSYTSPGPIASKSVDSAPETDIYDMNTWETFTDADLAGVSIKYPPGWKVKGQKNYTQHNWWYVVFPPHSQEGEDIINIKGRVECEWTSPSLTRCVRTKEVGDVYTFSQYPETLKMFDVFIKQFTIVKDFTVYSLKGDASWQIWQNDLYGYEMKYPPDWTLISSLKNGAIFADSNDPERVRASVLIEPNNPEKEILNTYANNNIVKIDEPYFTNLSVKAKLYSTDTLAIYVIDFSDDYITIITPIYAVDIASTFDKNFNIQASLQGVAKVQYCGEGTISAGEISKADKPCTEEYLGNIKLTLKDSNGEIVGTDIIQNESDVRGLFNFDRLTPGTYTINAELPKNIVNEVISVVIKPRAQTRKDIVFKGLRQ